MTNIDALIDSAKTTPQPQSDPVEVVLGGELVTFRFTRAVATDWARNCARFPARLDVDMDRVYGYNFHQVSMITAAETGVLIEDDGVTGSITALTEEQWRGIFAPGVLSGHDLMRIVDAVWALNEWDPQQKVLDLKKASRIASEPSSDSPASSESPTGD